MFFLSAETLLPSPSNFVPFMSLSSPNSFALKYLVWEMSNTTQYILRTYENIIWKRLTHIQTENILTPVFMASPIAAACGTAATEHGLSKLPPGAWKNSDLSQAAHPKPTTYMEKRYLKHETLLIKSPHRGLSLKNKQQEGAVSTDRNSFPS